MDKITGFQPEYMTYIKGFPRLQFLSMAGITDIDKQIALIFSSLHNLEELDIRSNYILTYYLTFLIYKLIVKVILIIKLASLCLLRVKVLRNYI